MKFKLLQMYERAKNLLIILLLQRDEMEIYFRKQNLKRSCILYKA